MDKYVVSARKYRPTTFRSVVGQHALVKTLKNAVQTGRLANSYLFCGQRGVGKTTMARIFAKSINCEHLTADGEPCNECESCRAFNEQRSMNIIELDAASNNSVEDIRQLTEQVRIPPVSGKYRVFIIDEVHMLSVAAFNAFLKTLEEPPAYVIFILATTEKQKIIPTILSRCQKYDFQSITVSDIVEQLSYIAAQEGYHADPAALHVIAQKSDGAMRDALSIFDQVAAASMGNITYRETIDNLNILDYDYYFRLTDAFLKGDVVNSLLVYQDVRNHGFDSRVFINGVASHLRNLVMAHSPELLPLLDSSGDIAERYREQSLRCSLNFLYAGMDLCNTCDYTYRDATNKQFLVELTLIKICQLNSSGQTPTSPVPSGPKPTGTTSTARPAQSTAAQSTASTVVRPGQPDKSLRKAEATPVIVQPPKPDIQTLHEDVESYKGLQSLKHVKIEGVPSISIRDLPSVSSSDEVVSGQAAAVAAQSLSLQKRSKPYTEEQFREAWRNFIQTHKNNYILLTKTMMFRFPDVAEDGTSYLFIIDNPAQYSEVEQKLPDLVYYLRNELQNDNITIRPSLKEKDDNEKIWTQKELLLDIVSREPELKKFLEKYKLGLM